ncbi:MAG: hypothetical protein F6K31_28365, partial [Symploca sp. SIO2G7]|nr:hypothetical protein [Symploca sp. SIO2G7]
MKLKIKTTHIIIGCFVISIVAQGENVRNFIRNQSSVRQQRSEFNQRIRESRDRERQLDKLSKVALGRAKSCIFVVDEQTMQQSYFKPGMRVVDRKLGRTIRAGQAICNKLGDTGMV